MGYNTLFAIRGSDFENIKDDEAFGHKLKRCVMAGNDPAAGREKPGSGVFLSDLSCANNHIDGYEIQSGFSRHADEYVFHAVHDGHFWTVDRTGKAPWSAYVQMAQKLSEFGYTVKMPSEGLYVTGRDTGPDGYEAGWERMGGYDASTFANSLFAFVLLNDGLATIDKDENLGSNIARAVHDWWDLSRTGHDMLRSGNARNGYWRVENTISSRNHANPISIIGTTPAGQKDIVCIGQNWGRMISACPDVDMAFRRMESKGYTARMDSLLKADLIHMKDTLRHCGFAVVGPDGRYEDPFERNREHFVSDPDFPTPEEFGA